MILWTDRRIYAELRPHIVLRPGRTDGGYVDIEYAQRTARLIAGEYEREITDLLGEIERLEYRCDNLEQTIVAIERRNGYCE